jgi:outer membrane protein TolC
VSGARGIAILLAAAFVVCASDPSRPAIAAAEEARKLTLNEAFALARSQSPSLRIARARVLEMKRKSQSSFTSYLPSISTEATYSVSDDEQELVIPAGSLGDLPPVGPIPAVDSRIAQGGDDLFYATTTLTQPVTQLLKISRAHRIARADHRAAEADLRNAESSVLIGVQSAYGALRIAAKRREAAALSMETAAELMADAERSVAAGSSLPVQGAEARVSYLDAKRRDLESAIEIEDRAADLSLLLGLPPETSYDLAPLEAVPLDTLAAETYASRAAAQNPEIASARETLVKARHGVAAAGADFVPQLGLYAQHLYQDAVPFLPEESISYGFKVEWTVWDFWKRGYEVGQRKAARAQAEENLGMVTRRVRADVEKAHRRLRKAVLLVDTAREARDARVEAARLRADESSAGLSLASKARQAAADQASAEADLMAAELELRIARAELLRAAGEPLN